MAMTTLKSLLMDDSDFYSSPSNYSDSPYSSEFNRDENLAILEIITLSAIFLMIVLGNSAVLIALIMSRIKLRRMYFFLFHLSIADLITAFFNVLPQLIWEITYRFYGGNILCKTVKFLQMLGPYLSSFTLCATAIDRYQAVCYPLESRSRLNRSTLKVAVPWILALCCCSPQAFIFSYKQVSPGQYDCWGTFIQPWGERTYVTWYAVSSFFIPFIILSFTFFKICLELWRNTRRMRKNDASRNLYGDGSRSEFIRINGSKSDRKDSDSQWTSVDGASESNCRTNQSASGSKPHGACRMCIDLRGKSRLDSNQWKPRSHSVVSTFSKAKIKTIKLTVVIVICYICCSSPFNIVQQWAHWCPGAKETALWRGPLITVAMLLPSLNSCVNPWIYLLFNRNLLKTLKKVFCKCWSSPSSPISPRTAKESSTNNDINDSLKPSDRTTT